MQNVLESAASLYHLCSDACLQIHEEVLNGPERPSLPDNWEVMETYPMVI